MSGIVVGVDGSGDSKDSLRWAIAEARTRGCPVRAVHAWTLPVVVPSAVGPPQLSVPGDALRDEAERTLNGFFEDVETDGVEVERVLVEGAPAEVLIEASADADLLVVGSRGRGGFAGLLLGSVSQQCATHARCPVVIVHHS